MSTPAQSGPFVGPIFEILAGPERKSFQAHTSILSKSKSKSKNLKVIVEGEWKESIQRKTVSEDWDEETPIVPGKRKISPMDDLVEADSNNDGNPGPLRPAGGIKFPCNDIDNDQRRTEGNLHSSSSKGYSNEAMFLVQAKLYAMGDYMLLPSLREMTFERPRAGLEYIGSGNAVLSPLVDYVYANIVKPLDREEPPRRLITAFIATNLHLLDDGKDIDRMVRNGGDFTADVWNKTGRHVVDSKKRLEDINENGFDLSDY